jgi:hypothetical protein
MGTQLAGFISYTLVSVAHWKNVIIIMDLIVVKFQIIRVFVTLQGNCYSKNSDKK